MKTMKTNNKLLYHITPFLLIEVCLFFLSIYMVFTDADSWGGVLGMFGLFITLILLLVDLGLKKVFDKYRQTFITEIIIIALVFLWLYVGSN